jgi:hypothetical protein
MSRRTHSTIGIKQGVDPISMMGQMGHQDPLMTSKYVQKNDESLRSMFGKKEVKEMVSLVSQSLETKLESLKEMKEKGILPEEVYLIRVSQLLKESGF